MISTLSPNPKAPNCKLGEIFQEQLGSNWSDDVIPYYFPPISLLIISILVRIVIVWVKYALQARSERGIR